MKGFIFRRLLLTIPLVLVITFIAFLLMHLAPGNFFDTMRLNPLFSAETISAYETKFNLDQPFVVQYMYWLGNVFRGDFGYSFHFNQPVLQILKYRLFNTFLLSFSSVLLAWIVAVPLGALAAMNKNSWFDRFLKGSSYAFLSVPSFFICFLLLYLCARTNIFPVGGIHSTYFDDLNYFQKLLDVGAHMIVPLLALSLGSGAYLFRLMRANMIDALNKEFIFVLKIRGINKYRILFKHAFRNAINPLITLFGLELPALFSGAALIEILTSWPGLGLVMLQAVRSQDIFLFLGNLVMVSVLLIIGNLLADIGIAAVDPRTRK